MAHVVKYPRDPHSPARRPRFHLAWHHPVGRHLLLRHLVWLHYHHYPASVLHYHYLDFPLHPAWYHPLWRHLVLRHLAWRHYYHYTASVLRYHYLDFPAHPASCLHRPHCLLFHPFVCPPQLVHFRPRFLPFPRFLVFPISSIRLEFNTLFKLFRSFKTQLRPSLTGPVSLLYMLLKFKYNDVGQKTI